MALSSPKDRALRRLKEFERFEKAFLGSEPVNASLRLGTLSTKHPTKSLQLVQDLVRREREKEGQQDEGKQWLDVDEDVRKVVGCQEKDGRWMRTEGLVNALGGDGYGLPQAPEGIVDWKWCTALAMVFLRKHPECFDYIEKPYVRASYWVDDDRLLHLASENLAPLEDFKQVALDKDLVKQGRWRDAVAKLFSDQGYLAFVNSRAIEHEEKTETPPMNEDTVKLQTMSKREIESRLWQARALQDIGYSRLRVAPTLKDKHGRDAMMARAGQPLEEALPVLDALANDLQRENREALLQVDRGSIPSLPQSEVSVVPPNERKAEQKSQDGLQLVSEELRTAILENDHRAHNKIVDDLLKHERLLATEYEQVSKGLPGSQVANQLQPGMRVRVLSNHTGQWKRGCTITYVNKQGSDVHVKHRDRNCLEKNVPLSRIRLEAPQSCANALGKVWNNQVGNFANELSRLDWLVRASKERVPWRNIPCNSSTRNRKTSPHPKPKTKGHKSLADADVLFMESSLRETQKQVLTGIAKVQFERDQLEQKRALENVFEHVKRYEQRVAMLRNQVDVNGRAFVSAISHAERNRAFRGTTELIEEIRVSTCALVEAVVSWRNCCQEGNKSLMWNGRHIFDHVIHGLDFLRESKPLWEWYGKGIKKTRNPFFLAISLDERPPTPRSAMRQVLVNGVYIHKVSKALAEQSEKEMRELQSSWVKIKTSPKWWPQCTEELWHRIRKAEAILLEHERSKRRTREIMFKQ